jgi:hypothetical protein
MPWRPHPPDDETASASWYADSLLPPWEPDHTVRVRGLIPDIYEAYVRIDHPELEGEMPLEIRWGLCEVLPAYTIAPDRIFHAAWDGTEPARHRVYASMPRLVAPSRTYIVFRGDMTGPFVEAPDDPSYSGSLIINVWWPEDRAWCVMTEIDYSETYVGCSHACARALVADEQLQASTVTPLDRVDYGRRDPPSPALPTDETAAAWWYSEGRVWPERDGTVRVHHVLPSSYEAYVRIEHPDVEGELPRELRWDLARHLVRYTTTPNRVFYAVWESRYLATHSSLASTRRLSMGNREFVVLLGDLTGPSVNVPDDTPADRTVVANIWWSKDRAWCVVTDIDWRWTYVGCPSACADALLADERFKASPATLLDRANIAGRSSG